MIAKLREIKWQLYHYKQRQFLIWGLKNRLTTLYDDKLIEKLRNIYYGGIPASIILLSDGMSNGYCYDRSLLMAKAFLDEEDDVQLVYASIDGLRLNPKIISDDPLYADHCILERITKDGQHLIYDTSSGFIYDKRLYWMMEHPKVRKTNSKESIRSFIKDDEDRYPEDIERDKYALPLILPMIETTFGRPNEMYSLKKIELLQREIEYFKEQIQYDEIVKEVDEDMKRMGVKK